MSFETDFHWAWEPDGVVLGLLCGRMTAGEPEPVWFLGLGVGLCALMVRVTLR